MYSGSIALTAAAALTVSASASAQSATAAFGFDYVNSYGNGGLSQPYAGSTSTGQSYGTGVAVGAGQKVYSLVEANPNVGVGGCRGCFPAGSRTIAPSPGGSGYLGPYTVVRRTADGAIDTSFGAGGYVSAFQASGDSAYKFTSMCVDPGTGDIVVVGQETTSAGPVGVVERLRPPTRDSGTAELDTAFNARGATPGVVTIATPGGNNSPTLYGCSVSGSSADGHGEAKSGTIYVGGVDDAASSSLVLSAKIDGNGRLDGSYGAGGVAESPVLSVNGSGPSAEVTNVSVSDGPSDVPDLILSGFSFAKGTKDGPAAKATAMTVAVNDRTGALDTHLNGTGELITGDYGEAVFGRVTSTRGKATDLYVVYGTEGTHAATFVDYPVTAAVPDTSNPASQQTGTFSAPADFASAQGYAVDSRGQILVSGNTTSEQETLTTITGSPSLASPAPRRKP